MSTNELPKITVAQLRAQLDQLGRAWDNAEVQVWLPGSRVKIAPVLIPHAASGLGKPPVVLLEGNVMPGSALDLEPA